MELAGKTAFITGAASGLGLAVAKNFLNAGGHGLKAGNFSFQSTEVVIQWGVALSPLAKTEERKMATRLTYSLGLLAAIIEGLAPGVVPGGLLPLVIVVLGIAYAVINIDANSPQAFLTTALVIFVAGEANVLTNIHVIGAYLDAIVDQVTILYLAGGVGILGVRAWNLVSRGSLQP